MRVAPGENEYAYWLFAIGEERNFEEDGIHMELLPQCICLPTKPHLIEWMYPNEMVTDPEQMGRMALLSVRICDAIELNGIVLVRVPTQVVELIVIFLMI
ncbi:hypothetical protein ANCDUO_08225 [Ancylostoma duodenale]|uniref:Uncharacterized protein n=1 Tax=Ancylostoma duodenale TaxID=51022 RepID=A0A0C2GQX4_9BILA|nr:hypothetical protein ANCDUO_08225 [Ancylostoma duodenale]